MATADNAELLAVNGDPIERIEPVEDPTSDFFVIMKNGAIYTNLLECASRRDGWS